MSTRVTGLDFKLYKASRGATLDVNFDSSEFTDKGEQIDGTRKTDVIRFTTEDLNKLDQMRVNLLSCIDDLDKARRDFIKAELLNHRRSRQRGGKL